MSLLDEHYTEDELIAELTRKGSGKTKRTLRLWRQRREGPPWTTIGRSVLYPHEGLRKWLQAQTQQPVRQRRSA